MQENTHTPQEQFALDAWTVLENNSRSYEKIYKRARELRKYEVEGARAKLSDFIKDYFEEEVCKVLDNNENLGAWLIRETLFGWGSAPFDLMSKWVLDQLEGEEPLYTLEKDGAYKMRGTYEEVFKQLLKEQGHSVEYATKFGGYEIRKGA